MVKIDNDIPFDRAALVGCGVTTGVGAALNTARVARVRLVAVFGCGGVGNSVIQGARIAGARQIIAIDIVPRKLETARHFGATDVVLSTDERPGQGDQAPSAGAASTSPSTRSGNANLSAAVPLRAGASGPGRDRRAPSPPARCSA